MKNFIFTLLALCNPLFVNSFITPIVTSVKKLNEHFYKTYEPAGTIYGTHANQCIFYPGLYGTVPNELYQSFLGKLASNNLTVHTLDKKMKNSYVNIKAIVYNNPTTIIAHSSGAYEAIEAAKYLDNVDRLVLLDPVNMRSTPTIGIDMSIPFMEKKEDKPIYKLPTSIKEVVIINAKKSYKWTFYPFKPPFIPIFSISPDQFEGVKKSVIETDEHGHSDILDYYWSNIMHNSLSEGLSERDELKIDQYHAWVAKEIASHVIRDEPMPRLASGKWDF